jgi:prepilin signal peptidase PulO-like enzyme (type II secretory pathway)
MTNFWHLLLSQNPYILYTLVFVYGMIIGSYLNVCIFRIPNGMSTFHPPSQCAHTGKRLPWYDNIPVFSYLYLRGRSRYNGEHISIQYPLVEFSTGVILTLFFHTYAETTSLGYILFSSYLLANLIVVAGIDFNTCEVPYRVTVLPIVVGIVLTLFMPELQLHRSGDTLETLFMAPALYPTPEVYSHLQEIGYPLWSDALARLLTNLSLGAGCIFLFIVLCDAVMGRQAMGMGDALVVGFICAFFGPMVGFLSFFLGAILALILWKTPLAPKGDTREDDPDDEDPVPQNAIPFCPAMCMGAFITLICLPLV